MRMEGKTMSEEQTPPPEPEDGIQRKDGKIVRAAKTAMPKPETRVLWTDVGMRTVGRLLRQAATTQAVGELVGGQARRQARSAGFAGPLVGMIAARLATRSVPGAMLVGGVLVAKAVRDYRKAQKEEALEKARLARSVDEGPAETRRPAKKS